MRLRRRDIFPFDAAKIIYIKKIMFYNGFGDFMKKNLNVIELIEKAINDLSLYVVNIPSLKDIKKTIMRKNSINNTIKSIKKVFR